MPVRLESDVEKRVVRAAEKAGWWALKLVAIGRRGFPDRWFIRKGSDGKPEIVIIEFKAPGRTGRKLQVWVCEQLEKMGFEVFINVDNYEEAAKILRL